MRLPGLWLLVVVSTALVGSVDYLTGPDIYLTDFYMIPILTLAWFASLRSAIVLTLAVMAYRALLYGTVWQATGPGLLPSYVNLTSEAGFIALIVILTARLKRALQDAHRLALSDDLTGTANRRAFYQHATRAIEAAGATSQPLSLAYLDVDNFKQVNDRLGHHLGDQLLVLIGRTLQAAVRPRDLVARLGGDEFAILLPETDAATAHRLATACQNHMLAAMQDAEVPITFSMGVLTCLEPPANVDDLIARADALMYAAKSRGKNALVQATVEADAAAA